MIDVVPLAECVSTIPVLEWDKVGRSVAISALGLTGWLVTVRATYLLFRSTIKDNSAYIKQLTTAIKATDE